MAENLDRLEQLLRNTDFFGSKRYKSLVRNRIHLQIIGKLFSDKEGCKQLVDKQNVISKSCASINAHIRGNPTIKRGRN